MTESNTLGAVSVQFVLSRGTIDSSKQVSNYHFHVQLSPLVQAQPFEPFVSLIQLMAQQQALSIRHYFEHIAKAPSRLRNLLVAWFEQRDDTDIEPCNPDEYEYEQSEIRQMLYRLLSWVVEQQAEPIKIFISHCQYLPVSSSLLINVFRAKKENMLSIDLSATSQDLHDWWPEAQIQRDLKHRFLVSSRLETGQVTALNTLRLSSEHISKSKQIHWAAQLYCGDELLLLLPLPSLKAAEHEPLSKLENYSQTLWALTCVNRHDDANRTLSDLVQLLFSRFPWSQQAQAYQALFKHYMWFKRYGEAMLVASEYLAASLIENQTLDADYAMLLCFWTECLVGNFKYDSERIEQLTAKLLQRNWKSLYHFVFSSLWFDQVNFTVVGEIKFTRTQEALAYYLEDCNPLAISRTYHHLSVMFTRSNQLEQAGRYIELAVQFQQQMPMIERHYNALNGQCFYLVHAGKFSRALQAVDKAYLLVVEDGNFEQLCTTLFNVAYVAFFTNHYTQCIRIIDDIFSIMLLRGLTRTRFRSNYELKAMQAMCNFFRGDIELALAIFDSAPVEEQTSLEGKLFVRLLALLSQKEVAGHASFELELSALVASMQFSERNILLSLLARKFAHQISFLEPGIWQSELADNTEQAFLCCEQNNLPACKEWFIPAYSHTENSHLQAQFEKFNALKLARRELQIDLLKVENSLLKAALNFEGFARTCQNTTSLFAHFMEGLTKTIRVTYIHFKVQAGDEHLFDQRFGLSPRNQAQTHRFPINAPEINGHLMVSFDPITDVYQNELLDWVGHMVEQLLLNLDRLFDFKKSESLAYIDYLTGLSNRAALDRYFTDLKNRSVHSLIVGYVDLDNFKLLNDEFGHEVGDRYLKLFTEHLSSSIREKDRIFRVGGDEFVVVLENIALANAEQVARRFQHSFLEHLFSVEKSFSPTMRLGSSIGLLHLPGESVPKLGKQQILKLADQLMYQAKQSGVNCLCALQHVIEE